MAEDKKKQQKGEEEIIEEADERKIHIPNWDKVQVMDSQVCGDGRLLDLIDDAWRKEKLPLDEILVPLSELPDPESDNGDCHMTLRELEQKWNNLALGTLSENHLHSPTPSHN